MILMYAPDMTWPESGKYPQAIGLCAKYNSVARQAVPRNYVTSLEEYVCIRFKHTAAGLTGIQNHPRQRELLLTVNRLDVYRLAGTMAKQTSFKICPNGQTGSIDRTAV